MNITIHLKILKEGLHISQVTHSLKTKDFIASESVLYPDGFNGERHYHDNAHFSFVLKGGCAEKKNNYYERSPGSITFYVAGEPHQITNVTQPSYHINFELPPCFFSSYDISGEVIGQAILNHPRAAVVMLKAYQELQLADAQTETTLRMLLLDLVMQEKVLQRGALPPWVRLVRELVHDHWDKTITLQELSQASGVHPVTISRYFPIHFSCTLGEYMRLLKVQHAIRLIKTSRESLTGIAYHCGFADQSHFTRNFKFFTGMLPEAFRQL